MSGFPIFRLRSLKARIFFCFFLAPFFSRVGRGTVLVRPRGIEGIGNIRLGRGVYVADGALLAAVPLNGADQCELVIGDGCKMGAHNHIYATRSIVFEAEVLTAGNVYVSDNAHGYDMAGTPIMRQPVEQLAPVRIGRGSWLGQNVCVIGASIGQGCVVGANSVVLSDLPDFCVAVGAPARVIRRLDSVTGIWQRTELPTAIQDQS